MTEFGDIGYHGNSRNVVTCPNEPKIPPIKRATLDIVRAKYELVKDRDLSFVREYLVEHGEAKDDAEVQVMEREYKRFLAISFAVEKGRNYPVSAQVDPFWHTHIMFTHDYTKMCKELGGQYIHHVPATTTEARERLRGDYNANTIPLYTEVFGAPDEKWWPEGSSICVSCCDRDHHIEDPQVLLTV